ncbi:MAG: sugar-transfer associated ATP-grasp domain-containing protein [Sedimenticola sp.]
MKKLISLIKYAFVVSRRDQKGVLSQFYDILRLRFDRGKLGIKEYYLYGLYNDKKFSYIQKRQFVGWRQRFEFQELFNNRTWYGTSTDKILSYLIFSSLNFPLPELKAVFSQRKRYTGQHHIISDKPGLAKFFSNSESFPCFCKPVHGWHGRGVMGLTAYDTNSDTLFLSDGTELTLDGFYSKVENEEYIFQQFLTPHPEIEAKCGKRLCTLRIWMYADASACRMIRSTWKVAVGSNMSDNIQHGESGNLSGPIDKDNGKVLALYYRNGLELVEKEKHPDTGEVLTGFTLPCWNATKELCENASRSLPEIRLQAWDIALTKDGPVIVELSVPGDIDGPQLTEKRGLWEDVSKE